MVFFGTNRETTKNDVLSSHSPVSRSENHLEHYLCIINNLNLMVSSESTSKSCSLYRKPKIDATVVHYTAFVRKNLMHRFEIHARGRKRWQRPPQHQRDGSNEEVFSRRVETLPRTSSLPMWLTDALHAPTETSILSSSTQNETGNYLGKSSTLARSSSH